PTLVQVMTRKAAGGTTRPLLTMLTRMNVTAVALCINAPNTRPRTPASTGEPVDRAIRERKLGPVMRRRFSPTWCIPRKNRPSPRISRPKMSIKALAVITAGGFYLLSDTRQAAARAAPELREQSLNSGQFLHHFWVQVLEMVLDEPV